MTEKRLYFEISRFQEMRERSNVIYVLWVNTAKPLADYLKKGASSKGLLKVIESGPSEKKEV